MSQSSYLYFPDVFGEVVTSANTSIQSNNSLISLSGKNLIYEFGTLLELKSRIAIKNKRSGDEAIKYPLVWLVWERPENQLKYEGLNSNNQYSVSPLIFIAYKTNQDYTSVQRYENVFKPILIPIYQAILSALPRNKYINSRSLINHLVYEHFFWGTPDQGANVLSDYLDSIELKINTLTVNYRCG